MGDYNFVGIKLTPNIFKELLVELYDGKQFKRDACINRIMQYHQDNGGIIDNVNGAQVFKKASQSLRDYGMQNKGYGVWNLTFEKKEYIIDDSFDIPEPIKIKADKEIGSGSKSIYVYYYETYHKFAELSNLDVWQCKIGRTDQEPLQRIIGQAGTCFPESPHIALIIRCDNSSQLEQAIHSILKIQNKWIEIAPGTEWFYTNPSEIEKIYEFVLGSSQN